MSIILGTVLLFSIVAISVPLFKMYCQQTSDNPEEIPLEENEEEEEIIVKDLPLKEKLNVKHMSKIKEKTVENGIREKRRIIEKKQSIEEEEIVRMELRHLEREFLDIEDKKITDAEEIVEEEKEENADADDEDEAEKTLRRKSTPLSSTIVLNDTSPNRISQPITVQAEVHENNPMVIIQQPLNISRNTETPERNTKTTIFPKKKHSIGKKVKKFFTRSEKKKLRTPIEESGNSSDFPRNNSISEINSTPSNIVNQHPLANSTIINSQPGTMNLQFHSPSRIFSIYTQPTNNRKTNSPDDSGFRSFIETSTIYRDLPNGRNNSISLPLPDSSGGNFTVVSFVMDSSSKS